MSCVQESDKTVTLTLNRHSKCIPGQFVQISVLGAGECPISIASYSHNHMNLTINVVGRVTKELSKLKKGDKVYVRGPYGRGYPLKEYEGKNLILIGAGCGVAALKSIIEYVEYHRKKYKDILLFFGYRGLSDMLYKEEVEKWKKKFNIKIALSRQEPKTCLEWRPGRITQLLEELKLKSENTGVFICGPPRMLNDTVEILKRKDFIDNHIFVAAERLMYCATGACCHCMIREKFTCKDGPVFRYDEIGYNKND